MDTITIIMLIGLVGSFILTIFKNRIEFSVLSLIFTFGSFIAVTKDAEVVQDLAMLLYIPIVAMGAFTIAAFFKVKV